MVEISSCPVCHSGTSVRIEHRDDVPVMMHKLYDSAEAARQCRRGILDMRQCQHCGFSWNAQFDASLVEYSESYENDQTHSPVFAAHVDERAKDVVHAERNNDALDFLEVGCGQGGFLRLVAREAGVQLRSAEGFDPAFRGESIKPIFQSKRSDFFTTRQMSWRRDTQLSMCQIRSASCALFASRSALNRMLCSLLKRHVSIGS